MLIIAAYYWQSEWNPCCEPIFWAALELRFRRWGQNSVPATLADQKLVSRKEDVWSSLHTTISTYHKDLVRTLQICFFDLWLLWWPQTSPVRRYVLCLCTHRIPNFEFYVCIIDIKRINIELVVTFYVYADTHKEIKKNLFLGEKRNPSERHANSNLRNLTHITQKPSYVYTFFTYLHAQRNHSLTWLSLTRFLRWNRGYDTFSVDTIITDQISFFPPPATISAVIVRRHHDKMTHKHQSWYRLLPSPLQEDDNNQQALDVHRCWWNQHPPQSSEAQILLVEAIVATW